MAASAVVPTVDIGPLTDEGSASPADRRRCGEEIVAACEDPGVLQIVGHRVDAGLRSRLESTAREFFSLDPAEKATIAMPLAGASWRGWFPLGGELTAGTPDAKEGIYFGTELSAQDPRVRGGTPLHGPNLFPARPAAMRSLVLTWMDAVVAVGRCVLRGIAIGLDLEERWFDRWCSDPTVLFRIFHYPAADVDDDTPDGWGVAEHTDYGLLTLLAQDRSGGLEVHTRDGWRPVEPVPDAFVCNLGDMLERLSGGRFVATPHRVAVPDADRISMPLFLDPGWDVVVRPLPLAPRAHIPSPHERWDGEDLHALSGPYSEYLLSRVARVFPELFDRLGAAPTGGPTGGGSHG